MKFAVVFNVDDAVRHDVTEREVPGCFSESGV
jgi:hypothetical protein